MTRCATTPTPPGPTPLGEVGPDARPSSAPAGPGAEHAPVRTLVTDRLGPWAPAWDALVEHSPMASPFLRTWWLDAAGERPCYVLVLAGDRLIGGLALERRRVLGVDVHRVLSGGKLCPDHLDLLSDPARVGDVVTALRSWFRGPGARVLDLDGLSADAAVLQVLGPATVERSDVAVWEPLTTYEAYLGARAKQLVKNLRRRGRRCAERGITFRRARPEETARVLDAFTALHRVRPDRRALLREMGRIAPAVHAGVARGEVRLHVAENGDGECGGVLVSFTTGHRLRVYQTARSLEDRFRDVGTLLQTHAVEEACAEGMSEFDLLRGDEAYKFEFASRERPLLRARSAHGRRARALLGASRGVAVLRRSLSRGLRGIRGRGARAEEGS